jgi:hypothetical protein
MKKNLNKILFAMWGIILLTSQETNAGEQVKKPAGTVVKKVQQSARKVKELAGRLKEKIKNPKRSDQNNVTLKSVRRIDPDAPPASVPPPPSNQKSAKKKVTFKDENDIFEYDPAMPPKRQ